MKRKRVPKFCKHIVSLTINFNHDVIGFLSAVRPFGSSWAEDVDRFSELCMI